MNYGINLIRSDHVAENNKIAETKSDDAVLEKLDAIQKLLEEQSKKGSRQKMLQTVLLLCMVVVLAVGLFMLNHTVNKATEGLPELIETTTRTVQESGEKLDTLLEDMNSVDFDALNQSIEDLQKAAENLQRMTSWFG